MSKNLLNTGFLFMLLLISRPALAQSGILLTQLQQVNFGILPAGATRCSINANSSLVGDCIGNGTFGEIQVIGQPYYAYNVSLSDIGWVNNKIFRPHLNSKNLSLNAQGKSVFYVRGEVRFRPGFNEKGIITFSYQITVNYQ